MSVPLTPQGIHSPEEICKCKAEVQRACSAVTETVIILTPNLNDEVKVMCPDPHTEQVVLPSRE